MSKLIVVSFEFYESVFIYSLEQKEEEFCHYCTAVISASILDSGNTQKSTAFVGSFVVVFTAAAAAVGLD